MGKLKNENKKTLEWIFISILILITIIILTIFVKTKIKSNEIPSIFGYKPFVIMSGSMENELMEGDLALIKKVDVKELKVNDIIAFKDQDNYVVTHRIIKISNKNGKRSFITKGDNNNVKDTLVVKEENIEGIYKFKIKEFGKVVLFLQQPSTLLISLAIIIIGTMFIIVIDNIKLSKKERRELEELRKLNKE